jgi:hypothetical protein
MGHVGLASVRINLHDHHGPDPGMALSKYAGREEAAADVARLVAERI